MIYVALLRGINVGGNFKVDMKDLKKSFESVGMIDVKTFINSGNVIFKDEKDNKQTIIKKLEQAIEKQFGFYVKVLLKSLEEIEVITDGLAKSWTNDKKMKCDVMFLWDDIDNKNVLNSLSIKPEIEDVKYIPGAIIWRIDRENVTKSKMVKIIGTQIYKKMTVRNCNTVRKLLEIMKG